MRTSSGPAVRCTALKGRTNDCYLLRSNMFANSLAKPEPSTNGNAHTGGMLRARTFGAQKKEVDIDISVMNRQIRAAKPVTIRVK